MKYVEALFGEFRDAYNILQESSLAGVSTSSLDTNDTAIIITEDDGCQLFLPQDGNLSDRALALVEVYNSLCRDKAGVVDRNGRSIPENLPYEDFTKHLVDVMKGRLDAPVEDEGEEDEEVVSETSNEDFAAGLAPPEPGA
jgi:hypothetical protein